MKNLSKEELLKRVGDISQIARITDFRFESGKAEGMRGLEVTNGSGLQFTVLPSRCMDIAWASYKGVPLSFISKSGVSAPAFFEKDGLLPFKNFTPGLLTTCGLTFMGAPCTDQGEELGLHGLIANVPATEVSYKTEWVDGVLTQIITGKMRESRMYGDNMVLEREIKTQLGCNKIQIKDTITNEGFVDTPFMLLYHCNFGYPLVDKNTKLVVDAKSIRGRDARADEGLAEATVFSDPEPGFEEQVYYIDAIADKNGYVAGSLLNPDLGLKVTVRAKNDNLPYLGEWKQMGEGDYVAAIEPSTWLPEGRDKARERGELKFLKPGEEYITEFDFIIEEVSD